MRAERLRRIREAQGWSQRELAAACDLAENMIYRYENGLNDPSSEALKVIAEKLKVSADYLIGLTDVPDEKSREPGLNEEERNMLETYRREGWRGVIHLGADRLAK